MSDQCTCIFDSMASRHADRCPQSEAGLRRRIAQLEAKLAAAEADAGRYRWLRDNGNIKWSLDFEELVILFEADVYVTDADAKGLDAAIDAARGAKG